MEKVVNDLILKKYDIRRKLNNINIKRSMFTHMLFVLEHCITYEALKVKDLQEANLYKKKHLESLRDGIFKRKIDFNGSTKDLIKIFESRL